LATNAGEKQAALRPRPVHGGSEFGDQILRNPGQAFGLALVKFIERWDRLAAVRGRKQSRGATQVLEEADADIDVLVREGDDRSARTAEVTDRMTGIRPALWSTTVSAKARNSSRARL